MIGCTGNVATDGNHNTTGNGNRVAKHNLSKYGYTMRILFHAFTSTRHAHQLVSPSVPAPTCLPVLHGGPRLFVEYGPARTGCDRDELVAFPWPQRNRHQSRHRDSHSVDRRRLQLGHQTAGKWPRLSSRCGWETVRLVRSQGDRGTDRRLHRRTDRQDRLAKNVFIQAPSFTSGQQLWVLDTRSGCTGSGRHLGRPRQARFIGTRPSGQRALETRPGSLRRHQRRRNVAHHRR